MNSTTMRGRCTNLPFNCSLAEAATAQDMATPDTGCSECGSPLMVVQGRMSGGAGGLPLAWLIGGGIAALLVLVLAGAAYLGVRPPPGKPSPPPIAKAVDPAPDPVLVEPVEPIPRQETRKRDAIAPDPDPGSYLVRLSGSNTVGGRLAPDLAEAWLHSLGATEIRKVQRVDAKGEKLPERVVSGVLNGHRVGVEIKAHGTGTGVKELAEGAADIWMASAPVSPDQAARLAALGDMRSRQSEHTVGLDGIAIIVSPANPLASLTKAQVKAIFSGEVTDWSEFGRPAGRIDLYARDKESGTRKTFEEMVLGHGVRMGPLAAAMPDGYEDSDVLSDAVVGDPHGIGFIGMSYIKSAKALAISDGKASPLAPTVFSVRTENYPLSRRLFLYTAAQPKPDVTRFVEFALGATGQEVVQRIVVGLTPELAPARKVDTRPCRLSAQWRGDPKEFCRLRERADAIDASFRFLTGSSTLDNLATRNLSRVMQALQRMPEARVVLAGFADSRGDYSANCRLSKQRAEAVARGLETLGITDVEARGYCEELPVRDNAGEDFEKNRRVEVFAVDSPARETAR